MSHFPARPRLLTLAVALVSAGLPLLASAAEDMATLPTVNVSADAQAGAGQNYVVKRTSTATRTDTPLRDIPQSITVITRDLIQDQGVQGLAEAVRYVPGMNMAQGEGNRDTAVFRGNSSTGDFFVDGIRDDVQYIRDLYNIDRVEVLKGSNAMIFGRGGSGGVINRATRVANWQPVRALSLTGGSWNNRRATLDAGQGVNDTVAVRVTGLYEDSESYRDDFKLERSGINPTLALRAGDNTLVTLGYEHFEDDRTADRGVPSWQGRPLDTDVSTFFGDPDASEVTVKVDAFDLVIDHDFGDGVSLRNHTRFADYDKFYQNVLPGAVDTTGAGAGTLVAITAYNNDTQRQNVFNQTDLTVLLNTGAVKHTLLAGVELGRQDTDNYRQTGFFQTAGGEKASVKVSISTPRPTDPLLFKQNATDADNNGQVSVAAVYLQDQLELSPRLQAILGLRFDSFKVDFTNNRTGENFDIGDDLLSPRVGLIFKPMEAMSLYTSYSVAYVPRAGDQLSSLTATNRAFDPEEFTNYEVGAKWDVNPGLALTAAVYRLDRSNVVVPDPNDATRSILVDGQRTQGAELELGGKITPAWRASGGYAYQDGELTKSQSATVVAGAKLANVSRHTLSLWNRYDINRQWGAGLGAIYRSSLYAATDNLVEVPGFTRVDGALYYTHSPKVQMQVNVENLFDKKYYAPVNSNNNITPGAPRAVRLTLNTTF